MDDFKNSPDHVSLHEFSRPFFTLYVKKLSAAEPKLSL